MSIVGFDYSSKFLDIVKLDEDTDAAEWHRFALHGNDAFDRARDVRQAMHDAIHLFDDVLACGIEDPRGYNAGALYRIQGAVLSRLPPHLLVHPFPPSVWRKTVGLPGNASKGHVAIFANGRRLQHATYTTNGGRRMYPDTITDWPQDACDAYCIALATRSLLQHGERAA